MQVHGSCVARKGEAVLLRGPPGSGKSGLALRLHSLGFVLVADDRVEIEIPPNGRPVARAPAALAGLLEVRGVGVVALPHAPARLALVIELGEESRLPAPRRDAATGLPLIALHARDPAAADKAALALDCALGLRRCLAGAFEPASPGGAFEPASPGGAFEPASPGGAFEPASPGGAFEPKAAP